MGLQHPTLSSQSKLCASLPPARQIHRPNKLLDPLGKSFAMGLQHPTLSSQSKLCASLPPARQIHRPNKLLDSYQLLSSSPKSQTEFR
eukprot:TRINITY_DN25169_c0_g1_i1.p1 TRINITY_DN25169_c0_g1~~TRINITY_DN25169_c0_g1_i1.p1  ORF type:complete len:102 (+),score=2.34 TRINITY_DN25169_c0_g1_i1:45-308(+)